MTQLLITWELSFLEVPTVQQQFFQLNFLQGFMNICLLFQHLQEILLIFSLKNDHIHHFSDEKNHKNLESSEELNLLMYSKSIFLDFVTEFFRKWQQLVLCDDDYQIFLRYYDIFQQFKPSFSYDSKTIQFLGNSIYIWPLDILRQSRTLLSLNFSISR